MKISNLMWIVTAISLTGNVLNIKKKQSGFIVWVVANIFWLIYDVWTGLYSRVILDFVQTVFCVWGIIEWNKKGEKNVHRKRKSGESKRV